VSFRPPGRVTTVVHAEDLGNGFGSCAMGCIRPRNENRGAVEVCRSYLLSSREIASWKTHKMAIAQNLRRSALLRA